MFTVKKYAMWKEGTARKRRDPAILDREEIFLQLKIEEIFFTEVFFNHILNIISKVAKTNSGAPK